MAEQPSQSDPSSSATRPGSAPPGLRDQFGRTRSAVFGLVAAHFKLLSAELSEIMDQVKRAAALVGLAFAFLLLAGFLIFLGTILWFGEWVFGSIGWGVLHGSTGLIAIAVIAVLFIIPNAGPRVGLAVFVALVIAVAVGIVLWLQLTSRAWGWVGSSFFPSIAWPGGHAIAAADRPIVVGALCLGVLLGIVGLAVGLFFGTGAGRIGLGVVLAVFGGLVGALLGAFLGVPMSWGISIAVGIFVFNVAAPILAAILVLPAADFDELKNRFLPNQTIETTKETIEWVREQMPLGRKS